VDLIAAGKFEDIVQGLTVRVANDPHRPEWKGDSFFRRFVRDKPGKNAGAAGLR
jgi:hypothetical protein